MKRLIWGICILVSLLLLLSLNANAGTKCDLTFEVIPSKDAGPLIGAEVKNKLAEKNYAKWLLFTKDQEDLIQTFLESAYGKIANFNLINYAMGGFEGKSSPNMIFAMDFIGSISGDDLGEIASEITAAVGYVLIQDGTIGECEKSVGVMQSPINGFLISGKKGFKKLNSEAVKAIYSAMVAANDNLTLGYTYEKKDELELMEMLDLDGNLPKYVDATNEYFRNIYTSSVSVQLTPFRNVHSVYLANNWAKDPQGISLLEKVRPKNFLLLLETRQKYIDALKLFSEQ